MPFYGEIKTKDETLGMRMRRIEYLNFALLHIKKVHRQYPHISLLGMIRRIVCYVIRF